MYITNNIRFTKGELESVARELNKEIENIQLSAETESIKSEGMHFIKNSAQRFIAFMKAALKYIEQFELMLNEMYKIRNMKKKPEKIQALYRRYEKQRSIFLTSSLSIKILQETERFQQALSTFLGQSLKTIYVFEGKIYDISNIPIKNIVSAGYTSSNKFQGVYNSAAIKNIIKNQKELAPELKFDESVTPVYQESLRRYQATKNQVIFWKEKGRSMVQRVQSRGSIEEAYANLAISRNVKFSNKGWTEADIGIFVKQGVMQVDNVSGRLKGDFAIGDIEYAVKSLNASMVGIKQFIVLAEMILTKEFNIDKLRQVKAEDEKKGRSINALSTELTEELNSLIEKYFINA